MLDLGCWLEACASRGSETHYGRGVEKLSGFGHDFIVICRLEEPDRRRVGRLVAVQDPTLRVRVASRLVLY